MYNTFVTRKFTSVTDQIVQVPDDVVYIVSTAAATTVDVSYTLEPKLIAEYTKISGNLTFADANPDTITRANGSWIEDNFTTGMTLTVANSVSNDGASYTIASVTEKVITLIGGDTLAAEVIDGQDVNLLITGLYDDASIWFTEVQVAAAGHDYVVLDHAPNGIRFVRTAGAEVTVWVKS